MSDPTATPPLRAGASGILTRVIESREKDLGGFSVRRLLPAAEQRMVGPFIFFDHMGPADFQPGHGIQVRPHPHIGLATVTYLFDGEILHRDSLGFVQPIRAGAVNLMTAGRGIVHSERAPKTITTAYRLHGIQTWMALPLELEDMAPDFIHYSAESIPETLVNEVAVRIIMGTAYGLSSPVHQHSPTLYLECRLPTGASLALPREPAELAVYVVDGRVSIDGRNLDRGTLAVLDTRGLVKLEAPESCHLMVIGGEPVGTRQVWWNFVASSKARIEQAKSDWQNGRFDPVPGDHEFIPLPE